MGTNQSTPCSCPDSQTRAGKSGEGPSQPAPTAPSSSSHPRSQGPEQPAQPPPLPVTTVKHEWEEPSHCYTIDRDPPSGEWYKYQVGTLHVPVRHQFLNKGLDTPWYAEFELCVDNLDLLSRVRIGAAAGEEEEIFPWRANLDKAYNDRIYVDYGSHWAFPGGNDERAMLRREICLGSTTTEETTAPGIRQTLEYGWIVSITIWSRDGDWLADELTYPKLGRLFNEGTTVATWATVRDDLYDPLEVDKPFFRKYHHNKNGSIRHKEMEAEVGDTTIDLDDMQAGHVESSLAIRLEHLDPLSDVVDEPGPGLRRLVEEHLGRHIYEQ